MSAIAAFYLVQGERLGDIVAAAAPAPRGWFRPARDTFWDLLRATSHQLQAFEWSGWVFATLDMYFQSRHGVIFDRFGDATASRQLSDARGSSWLVLPAASAAELLTALGAVECATADVTAFVAGEHGAHEAAAEAVAVQAALAALKTWLAAVSPGSVGLLHVG